MLQKLDIFLSLQKHIKIIILYWDFLLYVASFNYCDLTPYVWGTMNFFLLLYETIFKYLSKLSFSKLLKVLRNMMKPVF